jgi:hypothetical protein
MAEIYLIPFINENDVKGKFYSYLKDSKPPVSYVIMSRFLSLLTNNRNLLEDRINYILNREKIPVYFTNILQIINTEIKKTTGFIFSNVLADGLVPLINTQTEQYKKLIDVMFEFFKELRRQIPTKLGDKELITLAITDFMIDETKTKLKIKVGDLYFKQADLQEYKKVYQEMHEQKNNKVIENIIVDADEPTGGAAAGGSGGSQPTPARLPPANTVVEEETPTLADPSSELKVKPQTSRVKKPEVPSSAKPKKRALKAKRK